MRAASTSTQPNDLSPAYLLFYLACGSAVLTRLFTGSHGLTAVVFLTPLVLLAGLWIYRGVRHLVERLAFDDYRAY